MSAFFLIFFTHTVRTFLFESHFHRTPFSVDIVYGRSLTNSRTSTLKHFPTISTIFQKVALVSEPRSLRSNLLWFFINSWNYCSKNKKRNRWWNTTILTSYSYYELNYQPIIHQSPFSKFSDYDNLLIFKKVHLYFPYIMGSVCKYK